LLLLRCCYNSERKISELSGVNTVASWRPKPAQEDLVHEARRFVCVQPKKKLHTTTEKMQTNKQPRFASHLLINAPDRTWILQEEERIKSLMKKYQRNNYKEKLKNNNDNQRTQSSLRRSRVEFFSDEEKTVCRDDILDDVPRFSGILLPSFFVLPLSSSFPPIAAATPRNNFLKAFADPAIRWREKQQEKTRLIRQEIHRLWRYSFKADSQQIAHMFPGSSGISSM
jgi:hypothetical protein